MDTDSTTIDYKIIDVFPPEESPFQYENLQKEDNSQNYERLDLKTCEVILTLQFETCNLKELSINVVSAAKLTVKLFRQGQSIEDIYQSRKIMIDNKSFTFDFKTNNSCKCIIEILTKNQGIKIKSIILKSQPYPEITQIKKGQEKAVGQNQDKLKLIPKPEIDLVGSQPIQGLIHPPKMDAKIQTQTLNKKEEEQKEMKLQQFVRNSSATPIHINEQKNPNHKDQKPNKQYAKSKDHAQATDKDAIKNQKQQFEEAQAQKPQEEDFQEFKSQIAKPQDVKVNQYQTVVKMTQNSRGIDLVANAKKIEELNKKKKQQEQEESQRDRKGKNKVVPKKQEVQKPKQQEAKSLDLDKLQMSSLHPSDLCPQFLAQLQSKGIDLLKRYKALIGMHFYINQQHLDDKIIQYYRKIITDNGAKVQQEIDVWTDYIISNEVLPGVEIKSTQKFLSFQFLEDFQPLEKPLFDNYIIN